jgi:hypothetical protein
MTQTIGFARLHLRFLIYISTKLSRNLAGLEEKGIGTCTTIGFSGGVILNPRKIEATLADLPVHSGSIRCGESSAGCAAIGRYIGDVFPADRPD